MRTFWRAGKQTKLSGKFRTVFCVHTHDETPLHTAVGYSVGFREQVPRQLEIVKLLLSHGADVNARTTSDETPLHLTVSHGGVGSVEITKFLVSQGADVNAISRGGGWLGGGTPLDIARALNRSARNTNSIAIIEYLSTLQ